METYGPPPQPIIETYGPPPPPPPEPIIETYGPPPLPQYDEYDLIEDYGSPAPAEPLPVQQPLIVKNYVPHKAFSRLHDSPIAPAAFHHVDHGIAPHKNRPLPPAHPKPHPRPVPAPLYPEPHVSVVRHPHLSHGISKINTYNTTYERPS